MGILFTSFILLSAVQITLTAAIKRFLDITARVTPRWFNKLKFHILIHLPEHIRHFGPAILFATETFESFNALIRDHSVHSNRQAPSRDIARAFANANRIRHLLSGGKFLKEDDVAKKKGSMANIDSEPARELSGAGPPPSFSRFQVIGKDVLDLIQTNNLVRKLFGGPEGKTGAESTTLLYHALFFR